MHRDTPPENRRGKPWGHWRQRVFQQNRLWNTDPSSQHGAYAEAESFYQAQAANSAGALGQEALYKSALCMRALNREKEAEEAYTKLLNQEGDRWPPMAAAQVMILRIRQRDLAAADAVFGAMRLRWPDARLPDALSDDLRREMVDTYRARVHGFNMFSRVSEETARNISDLYHLQRWSDGDPYDRLLTGKLLMEAHAMAGHTSDAIAVAEELFKDDALTEFYWVRFWVLEEYIALMVEAGTPDRAVTVTSQAVEANQQSPNLYLLLYRARALAAVGRWAEARKDIDLCEEKHASGGDGVGRALLTLGFVHEHLGDQASALEAWRRGNAAMSWSDSGSACSAALPARTRSSTLDTLNHPTRNSMAGWLSRADCTSARHVLSASPALRRAPAHAKMGRPRDERFRMRLR